MAARVPDIVLIAVGAALLVAVWLRADFYVPLRDGLALVAAIGFIVLLTVIAVKG